MANNNDKQNAMHDEPSTTKYMIRADFTIDGLVEKPDVVGALFGQTEGLLSEELELRELQKSGRVGRIQVHLNIRGGKTRGYIDIPSSLDKVETSILAAAIETVDRIGPCSAKISIKGIDDIRVEKMKKIRARASELLQKWNTETHQDSSELADEVLKAARVGGIIQYRRLPAGPEINDSDSIIVVEGRADIAACLRAGVRNTIAVEGASVPKVVIDLTKKRSTIAFLDGDRGGDLILKELLMYSDIDYVARAPSGKEVEELKPDEIIEQLSKKVPIEQASFVSEIHAANVLEKAIKRKAAKKIQKPKAAPVTAKTAPKKAAVKPVTTTKKTTTRKPQTQTSGRGGTRTSSRSPSRRPYSRDRGRPSSRDRGRDTYRKPAPPKIPDELLPIVKEIDGKEKQEGIFLDDKLKKLKTVSVAKIIDEIKKSKGVTKVIFDGIITQRLIDACDEKNINVIVGARVAKIERRPAKLTYYTFA
ncbi:MAG: DNA primase [Asgard group archaeon]|nr:DNA primase [Asgard group archaeon]